MITRLADLCLRAAFLRSVSIGQKHPSYPQESVMQGGTEPEWLYAKHVGCMAVYTPFQCCSQMLQALLVQKAERQGFPSTACSFASARGKITMQ